MAQGRDYQDIFAIIAHFWENAAFASSGAAAFSSTFGIRCLPVPRRGFPPVQTILVKAYFLSNRCCWAGLWYTRCNTAFSIGTDNINHFTFVEHDGMFIALRVVKQNSFFETPCFGFPDGVLEKVGLVTAITQKG
jgi:hypothetical protein